MNEIVNNALPANILNKRPGQGLAMYIGILWQTLIIVGGLAFVAYLLLGALELLMSAGDKGKVENAWHKITYALLGLLLLIIAFTIIVFIEKVTGISLLRPVFPDNL